MSDNRPRVQIELVSPSGQSISVPAIIDTGASGTVIPESSVSRLGPQNVFAAPSVTIRTAAGNLRDIRAVWLTVRVAGVEFKNLKCTVLQMEEALLGWDVLSDPRALAAVSAPLFDNLALVLEHISVFKEKFVLVLGQDTSEVGRLRDIQSALTRHEYTGIIMKDIADSEAQCLEEKVNMIGSLSRFVICENSTPSGHIAELQICTRNRFVTAILQEKGRVATWMQADYGLDFAFVRTLEYASLADLNHCVDQAVGWANKKILERREYLDEVRRMRGES